MPSNVSSFIDQIKRDFECFVQFQHQCRYQDQEMNERNPTILMRSLIQSTILECEANFINFYRLEQSPFCGNSIILQYLLFLFF
jgi:hypothetical protein